MFKIGDKVIEKENNVKGTISKIDGNKIWSENWSDGQFGYFTANYLQLISSDEPNKQRTIKMKLNSMMKKLLDEDTKKLIKASLINGDLELTEEGRDALQAIMFEEKKAELVKLAEEKIAEEKAEK